MKQSKRAKRPTIPHLTTRHCIVRSATENIPTRTEPSARTAQSAHGCSSVCSVCSVTTKKQIVIILALIAVSVALGLIAPYFGTKMLYDDVLSEGGSLQRADTVRDTRYGGILTAVYGFSMIYGVIISRITPQVIHKLRTDIFLLLCRSCHCHSSRLSRQARLWAG